MTATTTLYCILTAENQQSLKQQKGSCRFTKIHSLKRQPHIFLYGIYPVEGIGVFRVPKNGDA